MAAMLSTFASSDTSRRLAGARHCGQTVLTASDCVMQLLRTRRNVRWLQAVQISAV